MTDLTSDYTYRHVYDHELHRLTGSLTFAIAPKGEDAFQVGVAICSPKDNFCYAKGRSVATRKGPCFHVPKIEGLTLLECIFFALRSGLCNGTFTEQGMSPSGEYRLAQAYTLLADLSGCD